MFLGILIAWHDPILVYALAGGASKGGCISVTGSTEYPRPDRKQGEGLRAQPWGCGGQECIWVTNRT